MTDLPYPPHTPPPPPAPRRKGRRWLWAVVAVLAIVIISVSIPTDDDDQGGNAAPTGGVSAAVDGARRAPDPPPAHVPDSTPSHEPVDEPTAPEFREPEVHQGTGDDVVSTDWPAQLGIVTFECPGCSGNTIVETDGSEFLLVNEIGPYTGTRWINSHDGGLTTQFVITATGSWTLTIADLDAVRRVSGEPATGDGDDVILLDEESTQATITNQGESNFIVEVLSVDDGFDLAVNEIGSYQGTVPLRGPALVQVTSAGHWSIDPS